jgi:2-polyprenyl-3-methyl-5-hydroxy-6-metoxy-1,4-benzoquinol methylase
MNADEYLKHWKGRHVWTHLTNAKHRRRFDVLADHLEGADFIDVGCALGHSTLELARRRPLARWTGLDFSQEAIDGARAAFPTIPFIFSPDYDLQAACGRKWDGVVCSEVLEHVEDKNEAAMVAGLLSITARTLVLSTPAVKVGDPGHLRLYTPGRISEIFKAAGASRTFLDGPYIYGVFRP